MRGARRREGEKPWGRNLTGGLGFAGVMWLLVVDKRWRGKNLGRGGVDAILWDHDRFAVMYG
jgi:hypothetical protein